jgi:hypothetical protein
MYSYVHRYLSFSVCVYAFCLSIFTICVYLCMYLYIFVCSKVCVEHTHAIYMRIYVLLYLLQNCAPKQHIYACIHTYIHTNINTCTHTYIQDDDSNIARSSPLHVRSALPGDNHFEEYRTSQVASYAPKKMKLNGTSRASNTGSPRNRPLIPSAATICLKQSMALL